MWILGCGKDAGHVVQNNRECCFASADLYSFAGIRLMGGMVLLASGLGSGNRRDFAQHPDADLANTRGLASDRMSLSLAGHLTMGLMSIVTRSILLDLVMRAEKLK
jgi:hypothetical protein